MERTAVQQPIRLPFRIAEPCLASSYKQLTVLKHTRDGRFLPNTLHAGLCISAIRDFSNDFSHRHSKLFQIARPLTLGGTRIKRQRAS